MGEIMSGDITELVPDHIFEIYNNCTPSEWAEWVATQSVKEVTLETWGHEVYNGPMQDWRFDWSETYQGWLFADGSAITDTGQDMWRLIDDLWPDGECELRDGH